MLVIAKLDRLARNVHFISGLMESGAEFVAVDMPYANKLTLHLMAAFAEFERELIRERQREGGGQAEGGDEAVHLKRFSHEASVPPSRGGRVGL